MSDEPLRIGINGSALLSPLTGIGQYTKNLAEALIASGEVDLSIFYLFTWSRDVRTEPIRNITRLKELIKKIVPRPYLLSRALQQMKFTQGARRLAAGDPSGNPGPYEAALVGNPVADAEKPLEILRTLHSFDPCLACGVHVLDPEGREIVKVRVR